MEGLTDHDWRRLIKTIEDGTCILVVGPGVAVNEQDPERTPLTTLLARALAEKLGPHPEIVNPDDLRQVAQVFQKMPENDHVDLEFAVCDFYAPFDHQITNLHRHLANLPFSLCVNTTHDAFLVNAFKAIVGKVPQVAHYNFRKPKPTTLLEPTPASPVVFYLYGNRSDPNSLVLTENDLLDFLVAVVKNTPPLPSYITGLFSKPETSFLFLGFGFQSWYVRILLHVLQVAQRNKRSLALEDAGFFNHPDRRQTAIFFEREHLIGFKLLSWEKFVGDLAAQHATLVGGAPAASVPANAPLAFLSYVHEDRDVVAHLGERLQDLGIRVWLDKQNLRGGDDWDRLIQDVIGKHVNYVVVVQSPRMQGQIESYVYKEIKLALERQERFARDIRFVIPVKLEPCTPLEELDPLHCIELGGAQGIEPLAHAIGEDWMRRTASAKVA